MVPVVELDNKYVYVFRCNTRNVSGIQSLNPGTSYFSIGYITCMHFVLPVSSDLGYVFNKYRHPETSVRFATNTILVPGTLW